MEKYGQTHSLQQTDKRLMIGAGVLVAYMFIGKEKIIFCCYDHSGSELLSWGAI